MRNRSRSSRLNLGRDQRRALLKGLATSLTLNEQIVTTRPKAKLLVPYFEKLVTKAKKQDLHSFRALRAALMTETAAQKLQNELAPRYAKRQGGYTSIKTDSYRLGDNTELVKISLTAQPAAVKSESASKASARKPAAKIAAKSKTKVGAK